MIGKLAMATVAGVLGMTAVGSTARADECQHGYVQPGYDTGYVQPGYDTGYVQPGYTYGGYTYVDPGYRARRFEEEREAARRARFFHRRFERRHHFWGW